jgi:glycosyltransferase involved in cell wall biosynthesis
MSKYTVILSVTNNLETDQRVNKVATSLQKMGFIVTVLGCKSRPCHPYTPPYKISRLSVIFKHGFLFYAEINFRFFLYLLFHHYDILVSNDTDTILPNLLVSKLKHKKWIADLHELFPEVPEVTNRKLVKKIWTKIEDLSFPYITHGYTVCESIANYYNNRYGIHLDVIRNIPSFHSYTGKKTKLNYDGRKIILYQGAVNEGRGIEWIMDSMQYIDNAVFIVIGNGDLYQSLKQQSETNLKYKNKVFFLGQKTYTELRDYTLSADLGVCLLRKQGLSYYYSLPNRIFDFMQAHVPILATNFPEISRVLLHTHTGLTINKEDPRYIAQIIKLILKQGINHNDFEIATKEYTWEKEEIKLQAIYEGITK